MALRLGHFQAVFLKKNCLKNTGRSERRKMKLASLAPFLPSFSFFSPLRLLLRKARNGGDSSFPKKKLLLCLSENMPPKQGSISISRFPFPFRFFPAISRKKNCILRLFFFSCASRIYELPINRPRKKRGSLLTRPCLSMLCFPQLFFLRNWKTMFAKTIFPFYPARRATYIFSALTVSALTNPPNLLALMKIEATPVLTDISDLYYFLLFTVDSLPFRRCQNH